MSRAIEDIKAAIAGLERLPMDDDLARAHLNLALIGLARRIDFLTEQLGIDPNGESDSR